MTPLRFGSFCSGIAAPEAAWTSLGWRPLFFSEIDPFASAVLAHHHPDVPNLGNMEAIDGQAFDRFQPVDVVVAGTPCQSFSVAGLRGGMADARGNLALVFLRLVDRIRPRWVVWENVPGVLSSLSHDAPDPCEPPAPLDLERDGQEVVTEDEYDSEELHAFNCFLAALSELGYGWAYRVLDAQHFGVPQRRRRVFVVGYLGDWRRAAAVLFERHCLSGNPAPSRETGARIAASLTRGADSSGKGGYAGRRREDDFNVVANCVDRHMGSGGPDDNAAQENHLIPVASTGDISHCLNAGGMGRQDLETETLIACSLTQNPYADNESRESLLVPTVYPCLRGGNQYNNSDPGMEAAMLITHSLRADGFDASEDGTGRGTPIVPVRAHPVAYNINSANSCATKDEAVETERARALDSRGFTVQQGGTVIAGPIPIDMRQASRGATMTNNRGDDVSSGGAPGTGIGEAGDPAPSVSTSHPPAVAFQERGRADGRSVESQTDLAYSLNSPAGGGRRQEMTISTPQMAVRRLTPRECERLQGFPDSYTAIDRAGKPAADGPRYRAIGNSMACPVLKWIGDRIEQVEASAMAGSEIA